MLGSLLVPPAASLEILYEDNHCLAVNKPAGLLTKGDQTGDRTLLDLAKVYVARKYAKPGAVFLGVVHRLDRPVSGVVLFARTSKAAARLSEQFRARTIEKTYLALVEGLPRQASGRLIDQIAKDAGRNVSTVVDDDDVVADGRECVLDWRRVSQHGSFSLLEIHPLTGRSHQIRVQLAHAGWPIVGDAKYGARTPGQGMLALHSASLTFQHPTLKTPVTISADRPSAWSRWLKPRRV
jgi:23S rRNA pseudouridine1911/1915/1917 synthase